MSSGAQRRPTDVRVGLTLPSFVDDPGIPLEVARAAEAAGLDGVFVFDHLFRRGRDGLRRPALEAMALLGAVATATSRLVVGTLVARASLRPAASLAASAATLARIAPGRLVLGLGSGDSESREENESFGLGFGTVAARVDDLADAVRATRDAGLTTWVGGLHPAVRRLAAEADGWNCWGAAPDRFAVHAAAVRAASASATFECSWGGLVVLDADDAAARAKAERLGAGPGTIVGGPDTAAGRLADLVAGGADWVIAGPVDSRDPANAARLAQVAARLRDR